MLNGLQVGKLMERRKLFYKFKEFQIANCKRKPETSSSLGYTNKKRTSYVYYVEFPHFLKELEVNSINT